MPNRSHPACVCRLTPCAFAGNKIKDAYANEKSGTATEVQKTIVKKMADGRAPAVHDPSPSLMPNCSHPACVCDSPCAFAGKNQIKGTASKNASKGTHPGYVVLDDNGVKRNARLHLRGNIPTFWINMTGKKFYIHTGCSELKIGTCHTFQGHTFTVLHKL